MDDKYIFPSFEVVNDDSIPAPLIKHSSECKQYNARRKTKIKRQKEIEENEKDVSKDKETKKEEEKKEERDKYLCINFNKFNRLCYDKVIPFFDDTHLNFSLGESLMYVINFYLQKKVISKQLYNRIFHSFQLALFEVLSEVEEDNKNKWNMKGKLLNVKKENNINIIYVENASLSFRTIKMHVPLLKIKTVDFRN